MLEFCAFFGIEIVKVLILLLSQRMWSRTSIFGNDGGFPKCFLVVFTNSMDLVVTLEWNDLQRSLSLRKSMSLPGCDTMEFPGLEGVGV